MMVKICGITNREDALAAIDAGASAIGFNFYPQSPRYLPPEQAREIAACLPRPTLRVGVFVDATPQDTAAFVDFLDIIQLHGSEAASEMPLHQKPVWKAFRIRPGFDMAQIEDYQVDAVLLDGPLPGTGHPFDWSLAKGLKQRLMLAGGLDESNVQDAIRAVRPWGVDACSKIESAPGRKDHERMRRFIGAALSVNL